MKYLFIDYELVSQTEEESGLSCGGCVLDGNKLCYMQDIKNHCSLDVNIDMVWKIKQKQENEKIN